MKESKRLRPVDVDIAERIESGKGLAVLERPNQ
jgi:hypothetical protein